MAMVNDVVDNIVNDMVEIWSFSDNMFSNTSILSIK